MLLRNTTNSLLNPVKSLSHPKKLSSYSFFSIFIALKVYEAFYIIVSCSINFEFKYNFAFILGMFIWNYIVFSIPFPKSLNRNLKLDTNYFLRNLIRLMLKVLIGVLGFLFFNLIGSMFYIGCSVVINGYNIGNFFTSTAYYPFCIGLFFSYLLIFLHCLYLSWTNLQTLKNKLKKKQKNIFSALV